MRLPIVEKKLDLPVSGRSRRSFLAGAGALGAAAVVVGCSSSPATTPTTPVNPVTAPTDNDIVNFALNLEYLEAEFYLRAATGSGIPAADAGSSAAAVVGGRAVTGLTMIQQQFVNELAQTEYNHVKALRATLSTAAVSRPAIEFTAAFTNAAIAAGVIKTGQTFDPFSNWANFLLGAFIFEDVGVTAYTGAAPAITSKTILSAAAGIQAVEAYHAAAIRTAIIMNGDPAIIAIANQISGLRATLGGGMETMLSGGSLTTPSTIVAADTTNSIAFSRSTDQVLHIVYGTANGAGVKSGLFFPSGLNGTITTTAS